MSNNKKSSRMNQNLTLNIVLAVILVLVDLGMMYLMYTLTSFSNLSKLIFIIINVVVLILLLALNFLFIATIKSRKKSLFNTTIIITVVLAILSGYGTYASFKVNKNVNKIVVTGEQTEMVEAAIVAKSGIVDISDLDGKNIGYVSGATYADIGKSNLDAEISANYVEYVDINTLFTDLVADEVDAAIMPSNYVGLFEVVSGYEEALASVSTITSYSEKVTVSVETSDKDITSEPFSILVLGVDEGRSDANMLVTVNPISLTITMTSIARDSYVPIACYSGQASDKLGHARVQGIQCTIDTIENLLDVEIDYYFESNFQGVVSIVDALGGIVINNPYEFTGQDSSDERGHYTVWIPAGENVPVNGEQALAFARERHLYASGDFQRQANQQHVVERILQKAMETRDLNKLLNVLDAAGDNVTTNITVDQFISLFNYIIEKANRYYDQDNIINMFNIVGSRVTGYNSSVWSEASQLAMSIVRPYEGSIADNHDSIVRNLDLNSEIDALPYFYWNAKFEYIPPKISNETYSEQIIQAETPQSYWCTTTGGTWDGSACACPAGEFVENKGCVQDSASNYTEVSACQAAGFIWDESTNTCVTTCPEGTTSDGKYCRATKADPSTYTNEADCINNGNKWDPTTGKCYAKCPTGTDDNDGDGKCSATQKNPSDYKDKQSCIAGGFKWDNAKGTCVQTCPSGTTDKNGVCEVSSTTTPPTTTPSAAEKLCTDTKGTWSNGACSCPSGTKWDGSKGCIAQSSPSPTPSCPANAICDANGAVTGCNSGYILKDGQCVAFTCPANATCDGAGNITCNSGYELQNGACVPTFTCPANAICENNQVVGCNSGYILKDGQCVAFTCPANATCDSSGNITCNDGYTLQGDQCVANSTGGGESGGGTEGGETGGGGTTEQSPTTQSLTTYSRNLLENNKLSLIDYIFKNLTFLNK